MLMSFISGTGGEGKESEWHGGETKEEERESGPDGGGTEEGKVLRNIFYVGS